MLTTQKVEGFKSYKEIKNTMCYNDYLCESRRKGNNNLYCDSIIGISQRPVNLNPGNLKEKEMKNF